MPELTDVLAAPAASVLSALAGARIAVVAPGGYAPDPAAYERAQTLLRQAGCELRFYCDPTRAYQRFGDTDANRAAQLHEAAADPEVEIVLALRGGYGMSRLLPLLELDRLAASGKRFVGHSDFTAFQLAMLARSGAVTFAGPMICDDFSREAPSDYTLRQFAACLRGPRHEVAFETDQPAALDVGGILWGGNLTMLNHLAGTPYFPRIEGGILFVEDVNEHPYRVERMLLQLLHAGVLDRQAAVVLGDFSQYRLSPYDNGYDFDAMLAYLRGICGVPVLRGLPFGHTPDKTTLPVGGRARLKVEGVQARLLVEAYPSWPVHSGKEKVEA